MPNPLRKWLRRGLVSILVDSDDLTDMPELTVMFSDGDLRHLTRDPDDLEALARDIQRVLDKALREAKE
jgi:hypothetical protein